MQHWWPGKGFQLFPAQAPVAQSARDGMGGSMSPAARVRRALRRVPGLLQRGPVESLRSVCMHRTTWCAAPRACSCCAAWRSWTWAPTSLPASTTSSGCRARCHHQSSVMLAHVADSSNTPSLVAASVCSHGAWGHRRAAGSMRTGMPGCPALVFVDSSLPLHRKARQASRDGQSASLVACRRPACLTLCCLKQA